VLALVGTAFLLWQESVQGAGKETAGKFTEEFVNVQSEDGIPNGGVIFASSKDSAKRIAVIWIHGWGEFLLTHVCQDWPGLFSPDTCDSKRALVNDQSCLNVSINKASCKASPIAWEIVADTLEVFLVIQTNRG